jgi:UDP-2,3-diacylglucosamine pyrophosphatase LpxH
MHEGTLKAEPKLNQKTKVKILVSDLHLGEGRRNWDGSLNFLEDFTVDHRFVEFIDYYSKAYDEVELILVGNTFEMLRCHALQDDPDVLFETYALELIRLELDGHPMFVEALREFMKNPHHKISYLMGEADAGVLWPKVQEELKERISARMEFFNNDYFFDGVYVQHGHQYDSMYSMNTADAFKEVNGLPVLKLPWGAFFNAHFIQPLRRLRPQFYRVRPMRLYLVWALFFETRFFFRIMAQFLRMLISASAKRKYPGSSFRDIFKLFSQAADSEALERYAEVLLTSDDFQKVIFGHSHIPNYRQFRNGKEYFNCGSWTKNLSLDVRSLGASHRLTYVLLEYRAEPLMIQAKLMEWRGKHQVVEDYS